MRRFLARWLFGRTDGMGHAMLSWPLALLVVLGLNVGAGYVLADLRFNNSPEVYYAPDSPAVALRAALRRDFPSDEALTVLFQGDRLYEADFLQRLRRASQRIEEQPLVDRVLAVTSFERISGSADGFEVSQLIDMRKLKGATGGDIQQRVLGDRFVPGLLASRDGKYLALVVRPKPLSESGQRLALKVAVASAIKEAGLNPYYVGDAGPVTMDVAQLMSILRDTEWLVPLTVVVGLALLGWVVGRLRPVVIGAVAMTTVVAPTIAAIVMLGQPYTMATAILPSLLAAYTVATLLHLYSGFQQAQRSAGRRGQWLDRALAETRKPSAFNVLTTGAGLLSLLLVPIPPIQVFGVAGAMGTLLVFLTVYFLVPPFLRHWDRGHWPQRGTGLGSLGKVAARGAVLSMRYPKTIVVMLVATMAALSPYLRDVRVETDLLAFFAPTHPINVDTRRIESALAGVTSLEISLQGKSRDTFQHIATLREVKRLQTWLETLPEVDRSVSMVDLVEEMHWGMNREKPAFRALPGNDKLLRQYLLVYDGNDLYELVNRDFDHTRILLNLNVHATQAIGDTIERIRAHVAEQPIAGVTVDVGGYGRLLVDQIGLLVDGQLKSFVGAFVQIFLIMALMWRSMRGAAVCMVPNLAPLFFVFVLMGATGIPLDLATVMIASVVLGITIDDTIHLYHGYRTRLQQGLSPAFAIARSYQSTGRAVLATSAVLVAQFGLLTLSDFIPTANFGLMTATGLLTGLLFEFLLPALLVLGLRGARAGVANRSRVTRRSRHRSDFQDATSKAKPSSSAQPEAARRVLICHGDACKKAGAADFWQRLQAEMARNGGSVPPPLTKTSCLGPCQRAPVIQLYPQGALYGPLSPDGAADFASEHLLNVEEARQPER